MQVVSNWPTMDQYKQAIHMKKKNICMSNSYKTKQNP